MSTPTHSFADVRPETHVRDRMEIDERPDDNSGGEEHKSDMDIDEPMSEPTTVPIPDIFKFPSGDECEEMTDDLSFELVTPPPKEKKKRWSLDNQPQEISPQPMILHHKQKKNIFPTIKKTKYKLFDILYLVIPVGSGKIIFYTNVKGDLVNKNSSPNFTMISSSNFENSTNIDTLEFDSKENGLNLKHSENIILKGTDFIYLCIHMQEKIPLDTDVEIWINETTDVMVQRRHVPVQRLLGVKFIKKSDDISKVCIMLTKNGKALNKQGNINVVDPEEEEKKYEDLNKFHRDVVVVNQKPKERNESIYISWKRMKPIQMLFKCRYKVL